MTAMQMLSPTHNVFVVAKNTSEFLAEYLDQHPFAFHIKADPHIIEKLRQTTPIIMILSEQYATIFQKRESYRETLLRKGLREIDKESEEGRTFFVEFAKVYQKFLEGKSMNVAELLDGVG